MTIVAVPYKPDFGHRDKLFAHLKTHYWNGVGLPLSIGTNNDDPFNRSTAINTALAGDWDYAVIADADTWVPPCQLHQALETAAATGKLVAAFDTVVELSKDSTTAILNGKTGLAGSFGTADKLRTQELETQSSMLVVPRPLWDNLGGMDERFQGWGAEDCAFWHACTVHAGAPERITGNAYHLWHPPAPGKFGGNQYRRNLALYRRYLACTSIAELQAI